VESSRSNGTLRDPENGSCGDGASTFTQEAFGFIAATQPCAPEAIQPGEAAGGGFQLCVFGITVMDGRPCGRDGEVVGVPWAGCTLSQAVGRLDPVLNRHDRDLAAHSAG